MLYLETHTWLHCKLWLRTVKIYTNFYFTLPTQFVMSKTTQTTSKVRVKYLHQQPQKNWTHTKLHFTASTLLRADISGPCYLQVRNMVTIMYNRSTKTLAIISIQCNSSSHLVCLHPSQKTHCFNRYFSIPLICYWNLLHETIRFYLILNFI